MVCAVTPVPSTGVDAAGGTMSGVESVGAPSARGKLDLQVALSSHADLHDMRLCRLRALEPQSLSSLTHCFLQEQQRYCRYVCHIRRQYSTV